MVASIERIAIRDSGGVARDVIFRDEEHALEIVFAVLPDNAAPIACHVAVAVAPRKGVLQQTVAFSDRLEGRSYVAGRYVARMTIPANLLTSAIYTVAASLRSGSHPNVAGDGPPSLVEFRVVDRDEKYDVGAELLRGVVRPNMRWDIAVNTGRRERKAS